MVEVAGKSGTLRSVAIRDGADELQAVGAGNRVDAQTLPGRRDRRKEPRLLMKTRWFLVIWSGGQWWVDCEGRSFGPFDGAAEATVAAIRYAEVFADDDRQSQVWSPDETGSMRQVWVRQIPKPVKMPNGNRETTGHDEDKAGEPRPAIR